MKTLIVLTAITVGATLSGCTTDQTKLVLDRVGPPLSPSSPVASTSGTLLVYSAYAVNADFNARDPNRPEYSDYKILSADGKLLQQVHNDSGTLLQEAVPVELLPGQYNVRARANGKPPSCTLRAAVPGATPPRLIKPTQCACRMGKSLAGADSPTG